MARIVDARFSTLIGTPEQLRKLFGLLAGDRASVVDLRYSNLMVLDKAPTGKQLEAALRTTPRKA